MHANGAADESDDEFVKVTTLRCSSDLRQLESDFVKVSHKIMVTKEKGSRETFCGHVFVFVYI